MNRVLAGELNVVNHVMIMVIVVIIIITNIIIRIKIRIIRQGHKHTSQSTFGLNNDENANQKNMKNNR